MLRQTIDRYAASWVPTNVVETEARRRIENIVCDACKNARMFSFIKFKKKIIIIKMYIRY